MLQQAVADSSVIFKWLYKKDEKYLTLADKVLKDSIENRIQLLAPELAKYEVGNILTVAKKLDSKQLIEALKFFYSLPITFFPDTLKLAKLASNIAAKHKITYYDASFVALAKQEKATLVTDNPKHQAKVKGIKVIALKDYK